MNKIILYIKIVIAKLIHYKKKVKFKSIGENVVIGYNCNFGFSQNIIIGSNVNIGDKTCMYAQGGIEIKDGSVLADNIDIRTANHYYDGNELNLLPFDEKILVGKVTIEKNVWIGSHVIILCGVTIGEGAVIGAGSIVTKNIPPLAVAVGNPAKIIKYRNKDKYNELKNQNKIYMTHYKNINKQFIWKKYE